MRTKKKEKWESKTLRMMKKVSTLTGKQLGSFQHSECETRPDIIYAVNVLSRKQTNHKNKQKRIFRNSRGTADLGLRYHERAEQIECYVQSCSEINYKKTKSISTVHDII